MSIELSLFYVLSILTLFSGIMVISSRNSVHSVLFLILVFFNSTGLLLLLGAEFIAMIILMVYVGAVAVLFLFVVMMLNVRISELKESLIRYIPIGGLIGILFCIQLLLILDSDLISSLPENINSTYLNWFEIINSKNNITAIGTILYSDYAYAFIISGMILLVSMIGAIVLTMYKREHVKRQDIFIQLTRDFEKAVYSKE